MYNAEMIIYRDPLKCAFESDGNDLQALIRQLYSMHYQTKEEKEGYDTSLHNKYYDYGGRTIAGVKSEIRKIYEEYQPDNCRTLSDQVVQRFCSPLGNKKSPYGRKKSKLS